MSSITLQEAKMDFSSFFERVRKEGILLIEDGSCEFVISYTNKPKSSSPFAGVKSVVTLKEADVDEVLQEAKDDRMAQY